MRSDMKEKHDKDELTLFDLLNNHHDFWKSTFSTLYGKTDVVGLDDKHRTIFAIVSEEGEMKDEKKLFDEHGNMFITDTCVSKEPILYIMLSEEQVVECVEEIKKYNNVDIGIIDDDKKPIVFDGIHYFDFSTLKEFDKVLVRYDNGIWHTDFVDFIDLDEEGDLDINLSFYANTNKIEIAPYNKFTKKFVGKLAILPPGIIWVPKNNKEDDYDDYDY